ncbi:MAG: hypothetical protein FJ146_07270 [Deltaproteobacteria bacterium]|nr:hypothetical protein [Deltaproteobacteria bacterium]
MSAKVKRQRLYWLSAQTTAGLQDRADLLATKGYEVSFYRSVEELYSSLARRRAGVVILSDDFGDKETEAIIRSLMNTPEIEGARMVFVRYGHNESLNTLAACANFRDIIPAEMESKEWLSRFIFATGGSPIPYVQPAGQVTLNNISALHLPARITRVSDSQIYFESRIRPPVGATMQLRGPLAAAGGLNSISLTVVENQRRNLLYRFSDGVVATWQVPSAAKERFSDLLTQLSQVDTGPKCRVLLAAQSANVRSKALSIFQGNRFEISAAIRKQGIIDSARFFTPDLVIIESDLVREGAGQRFRELMESLSDEATVMIIGMLPEFASIQASWPRRHLMYDTDLPSDLAVKIANRYLRSSPESVDTSTERVASIPKKHPFSLAEVSFPVRLHRIHSQAVQIAMPFPVGNFALARLETPLLTRTLGRNPYFKVTATHEDTHPGAAPFNHLAEGYFSDLRTVEQRPLADALVQLVTASLNRFDQRPGLAGATRGGFAGRTPELGSVRLVANVPGPAAGRLPPPSFDGNLAVAMSVADQRTLSLAVSEHQEAIEGMPAVSLPLDLHGELADVETPGAASKTELPTTPVKDAAAAQATQAVTDDDFKPPVARKPRVQSAPVDMSSAIRGALIALVTGYLLFSLVQWAQSHVSKSGSNFSNQLERFSRPQE